MSKETHIPVADESAPETPIRLTRRGKVAAAALTGVLVLGAGGAAAKEGYKALTANYEAPQHTTSYVIQEGDTLWNIAISLDPDSKRDIREIVYDIQSLNADIAAGSLDPGSTIELPDYSE